ncbi:MAG: hypothetical protein L3J24_00830 [Xanthomonadales bacterium]|nr:hypothetical protein [Xanthomonadales bacterium]
MKKLNLFLLATILAAITASTVLAQDHQHQQDSEGYMSGMMADSESRTKLMNTIAANPEMRDQMMTAMMQTMPMNSDMGSDMNSAMDMQKMMANPEMKARMEKHIKMMQTMLNSEGMSKEDMQAMMKNPEMKSMMKMHAKCSKMMPSEMKTKPGMDAQNHH